MLLDLDRLFALFQSTLSVRRATETIRRQAIALQFQSTLSVRRATHDNGGNHALFQHFNPRSP